MSYVVVELRRDGEASFGFNIKGGADVGCPVYIWRVEPGSLADKAGLRSGDEILSANNVEFSEILHSDALKVLKNKQTLTLKILKPEDQMGRRRSGSEFYTWIDRHGNVVDPPEPSEINSRTNQRVIDLIIEPGQNLGLMIRGGAEYGLGIYVTGVDPGSVAERGGLERGDQILSVNNRAFGNLTHDKAVDILKSSRKMQIVARYLGKIPADLNENLEEDVTKATGVLQMIEEKARTVLNKSEHSRFTFYRLEYQQGFLDVRVFVKILFELLCTAEKFTLLTEVRELIRPSDRPTFDELIWKPSSNLAMIENDGFLEDSSAFQPQSHQRGVGKTSSLQSDGSAYNSNLKAGQVLLTVDGIKFEGLTHEEIVRVISDSFNSSKETIDFLVVENRSLTPC